MLKKEKGPRPEKVQEVSELRDILTSAKAAIIADYRGLNVKNISALRKRLRDTDAGIRVVKNTLLKRAAEGLPAENLVANLEGPTALAYSSKDAVDVAKAITSFVREFKLLKVKGGITEGQIMDAAQITALSTMPPRAVLVAQVVGGLQGPVASFVMTMQQLYGGLVYTLQGIADKKK